MKIASAQTYLLLLILLKTSNLLSPHLFERTSDRNITQDELPLIKKARELNNQLPTGISDNFIQQNDDLRSGSDMRTQLMKSTLDFTDDLAVIIKRILMLRADLKDSKTLYVMDNANALFMGNSYKKYNSTPKEGRPQYSQIQVVNNKNGFIHERKLWDIEKSKNIVMKYMKKKEFENSEIEKPLKHFEPQDMYLVKPEDLKNFSDEMAKKNVL